MLGVERRFGRVLGNVAGARFKRRSMHHFATPDRVAPTDIAGVAAPASVGHVGPVGVVGEQLVAPSVPAQDVPVSVEGVGVDHIAPIEALYAVVPVVAYPLVERVVIVGALTGEVVTADL